MTPIKHYDFTHHTSQLLSLAVYRPSLGRWAVVAKLVPAAGELVLGIPYRHRQRLAGRISLPVAVLRYAAEHGAEAIVVRFDDERYALRLPLEQALRRGRRGVDA